MELGKSEEYAFPGWWGGEKEVPFSGLMKSVSFEAAEPVCQKDSYSPVFSPEDSEQNLERMG